MRIPFLLFLSSLLLALPCISSVKAQSSVDESLDRKTSLYLEALGNGGAYSINVERLIEPNIAIRVGFARWTAADIFGEGSSVFTTFPTTISYLVGAGSNKIEIGAGFLFAKEKSRNDSEFSQSIVDAVGILGYRRQKAGGRTIFRIGLTPFYALKGDYPDTGFLLSIGASFGYRI
jgi:hypothetical protein